MSSFYFVGWNQKYYGAYDKLCKSHIYFVEGGKSLKSVQSNDQYTGDHTEKASRYWKKNDIVGITLNCEKWRFEVNINDKELGSIKIKKNKSYYVFFASCTNNAEYKLLTV